MLQRRLLRWSLVVLFSAVATVLWPSSTFRAQEDCAGGNAIRCENALAGTPQNDWDVQGAGDLSIQGFATDISVNRGQTVQFKIDTNATAYRLDIYRLGYYGGDGARLVATVNPSAALPQAQPECLEEAATGLVDCGNWAVSASWLVPADATSGIYFARAVRQDNGGASHIVFIVRNDAGTSELLFQTSDTTWQAYNRYGGNSLYVGSPAGRAYKVSYNRPFTTRAYAPEDWVFNAEYPMVRWLESNGFDVSYTTGVDSERRGALAARPPRLPVGRPRRVLVRRSARQRRSGARRRRKPRVLQRQRGLLEDALGEQHRAGRRDLSHARRPTRKRTPTPKSIRCRTCGPARGATRASGRRLTAGGLKTR